jgi:outer membrane receptor protein involved in Fe transport
MKTKTLALILILLAITNLGRAQEHSAGGRGAGMADEMKKLTTATTGVITGMISDEKTGSPLEYCTILILRTKDSSSVGGGITNATGRFQIKDIPWGKYLLKINFIGYKPQWVNNVEISKDKPVKFIGKIKLATGTQTLGEVEVTAKKEMIQTNLDKKVFNVEQSITSSGGSAVDALQNIPSVQVDFDGNVSIRGSSNITILIDGRPSNMTLEQIPAASIESIEVVTNPSAKYDPDGMSGILNVILKKKKEHGFNGMVSANVGAGNMDPYWYFGKNSVNANLNYRYNKLNVNLSVNSRNMSSHFGGNMDRTVDLGQYKSTLSQISEGGFSGNFQNFKIGADYSFNKKNSISFGGTYGNRSHGRTSLTTNKSFRNDVLTQNYSQNSENYDTDHSYEFSGNYKKTFDTKGKEWTIDAFYSKDNGIDSSFNTKTNSYPNFPTLFQNNFTDDERQTFTLQTDFITPIGNGGRLETGVKYSYKTTNSNYTLFNGYNSENLLIDSTQINDFLYNESLGAAYAIYSNSIWTKLKYQVGLRYEVVNNTFDLKSQILPYDKNKFYSNPFPSAHIRYEFTENTALQISYSRRVNRPRGRNLNPFIDYSDSLNLSQGNPKLNPEFVNSYELSHYWIHKGTTINTTLFFRQRNDIITRYTTLIDSVTTMTSYANISQSKSFGAEFLIGQAITKWWKITGTGSYYRTEYSDTSLDNSLTKDYSWNMQINSQMSFGKVGDLQITFNYRSPTLTIGTMGFGSQGIGQGQMKENYNIDLGGKINIIKDKLSATLRVSDVFNWWKMDATTTGEGFYSHSTRTRESRAIWVGLSYKFNDYKVKREKRNMNGDDSGDDMY